MTVFSGFCHFFTHVHFFGEMPTWENSSQMRCLNKDQQGFFVKMREKGCSCTSRCGVVDFHNLHNIFPMKKHRSPFSSFGLADMSDASSRSIKTEIFQYKLWPFCELQNCNREL